MQKKIDVSSMSYTDWGKKGKQQKWIKIVSNDVCVVMSFHTINYNNGKALYICIDLL